MSVAQRTNGAVFTIGATICSGGNARHTDCNGLHMWTPLERDALAAGKDEVARTH
jgi:hypothetical protein